MDPNSYTDVNKTGQSAFYGALSGSVCFPMPLMYNPMNSYPFMSTPFLPMHHPMLSGHHGLHQDSHSVLSGSDLGKAQSSEDISSRALAYLQSRYQSMGKCFLPPPPSTRKTSKYLDMSLDSKMGVYGGGDSNGSNNGGGMTLPSLTEATSPVSGGGFTDKESYLSSPGTEVEEPDSSGKCSTDVVEQKVVPRWTCDSSLPPLCPICGRTISLQDLTDHYHMELDRLNELMRKKEWLIQDENNQEQINSLRLQSYHDVERKCPEFRKETYLRVRANRINRLGGCGPRSKRQCFEDTKQPWKMHRPNQFSPKQENISDESSTQSGHQSMLMLELTVQQLAHRAEARTDVNAENFSSEKNLPSYQGALQPQSTENYHEGQSKLDLADSSCNGFNNLDVGSCQTSSYPENLQGARSENRSDDNPCSSADIKCQVCLESYSKPVVSVCCWHVHCENCWLKALGNKRVCPQCEAITSPEDLRRIHL
ncbi:hypothetical protein JTE90_019345 [Oedothorax gibbosus]|uniref:RING-type domain-containing protein n=1 Tax=Oedothorax gibbosus TaxID=931172 RepID=A0AAV6UK11_9ARAC|nr:hypothetical protein JTE90_019345 [Oedothorax gibbosus]